MMIDTPATFTCTGPGCQGERVYPLYYLAANHCADGTPGPLCWDCWAAFGDSELARQRKPFSDRSLPLLLRRHEEQPRRPRPADPPSRRGHGRHGRYHARAR